MFISSGAATVSNGARSGHASGPHRVPWVEPGIGGKGAGTYGRFSMRRRSSRKSLPPRRDEGGVHYRQAAAEHGADLIARLKTGLPHGQSTSGVDSTNLGAHVRVMMRLRQWMPYRSPHREAPTPADLALPIGNLRRPPLRSSWRRQF